MSIIIFIISIMTFPGLLVTGGAHSCPVINFPGTDGTQIQGPFHTEQAPPVRSAYCNKFMKPTRPLPLAAATRAEVSGSWRTEHVSVRSASLPACGMENLDIEVEEAQAWYGHQAAGEAPGAPVEHPGEVHLLLGDSIARRGRLRPQDPNDRMLNHATGGATLRTVWAQLDRDIQAWETAAAAAGLPTGRAVIFLTGNDVYDRLTELPRINERNLEAIADLVMRIVRRLSVTARQTIILGPLSRPSGEVDGVLWERTAAYHFERRLVEVGEREGAVVVPLGRGLCRKVTKNRHGLNAGCASWFLADRTHLSPAE